jgi:hypothetical protein
VFAGIGFVLNLLHGLATGGPGPAVVMALVSVAGVIAHQLVTATIHRQPRPAGRRLERAAARRLARARRAAIRHAVVDLTGSGGASLLYVPGRYQTRRRHLIPATVTGLPVAPLDDWDRALAALTSPGHPPAGAGPAGSMTEPDQDESTGTTGRIALLDPAPPVIPDPSSPAGTDGSTPPPSSPSGSGRPIDPHARRRLTPAQALDAARHLARAHGRPVTAEQLRKALRIAPDRARRLRDQVNGDLYGNPS